VIEPRGRGVLDAPHARGMTAVGDVNLRSRGTKCPSYQSEPPSKQKRAQGMPDARCTRSRLCSKKHRRQQLQVHRNSRHSLHNGFNGVLRALLGDHAWLPPSSADRSAHLAPASERQDHTTSPSAQTPFVRAIIALGDVRPSHPIPNVRDDREAPLYGERDKRKKATDLGVRSIAADRDTMARRANYAGEACTFASHHRQSFRARTIQIAELG
jgi:hypothetical protein